MSEFAFLTKSNLHVVFTRHTFVEDAVFNSVPVPAATVTEVVTGLINLVAVSPAFGTNAVSVDEAGRVTVAAAEAVCVIVLYFVIFAAV